MTGSGYFETVTIDDTHYHVRRVVRPAHALAAERLARWCERDLYIGPTRIRWFEGGITSGVRLRGFTHSDEPAVIYLRTGQTERQTLVSVGHELFHRYQRRLGREPDEEPAEVYGRRVAALFEKGTI